MVDLSVRVIEHSQTEYQMSHKLWFAPAPGVDAISATANTDGFTVLNAVARFYGWNYNDINRAAEEANRRGQVAVLRRDRPNLFIVPRTKPSDQASIGALVDDLLKALDATHARQLQFTHFGFTNRVKFEWELETFLTRLLATSLSPKLEGVCIDIDRRCWQVPQSAYEKVQRQMSGFPRWGSRTLPHSHHVVHERLVPVG
jgi:hypothetical protein